MNDRLFIHTLNYGVGKKGNVFLVYAFEPHPNRNAPRLFQIRIKTNNIAFS
ncbi:hypothetical protein MARINOS108_120126 [Marinoscillum sp. 108]|nr:hypothetical protein MARINOS108_120126 [Marinoscillum sp. 108]